MQPTGPAYPEAHALAQSQHQPFTEGSYVYVPIVTYVPIPADQFRGADWSEIEQIVRQQYGEDIHNIHGRWAGSAGFLAP
jgi:hypothetical protein